ncbi:ankyrin repeat domain-containing protein [Wolbachia endosymbiont (group A) of Barypeithes pellucidus]|uniref:ankyrin repeat domain-containing protein n=1 Tax=Wolbachia endosymbiont (group A) of Barypeithes pellucidus TaxID=3139322 RepID=UPI003CCB1E2B
MTYEKIKEIVTNNPNITAEEFGEKLKQSGTTDTKICDLFMDIIRSTLNDRNTFLKAVELLAKSNIKIDIGDTVSKTVLDYAVVCGQPDVIKIFLESGKFDQKRKLNAFSLAINGEKVQEFEVFLDYIDHASTQEHLNAAPRNENTDIMKMLLDNKRLTGIEKVNALSGASIDGDLPKVRLLLKHMTGIPEDGIRNLLKIIEERKLSLGEELKIDSEFKLDFNNPNHHTYLSNYVIIAILRSAINKKEERNTPDAGKNGAGFSSSNISTDQTTTLNNVEDLCEKIDKNIKLAIRYDNGIADLEGLQKRLKREINFRDKCKQGAVLGNALLEHAIKNERLNTIKFLLQNGVTVINVIGQEKGINRYYISKTEESKSILCSVVSYTDNSNAEILSTLLQSVNAEQSKLNPEDELYILYQQLKDDAFCTAIAENNSVAATVLIQNDQETRASAVSKNGIPIATVHPILTKETNTNQTVTPNSGNGQHHNNKNKTPVSTRTDRTATPNNDNKANSFIDAQFSPPNTQETKYKESKENFYTSLTKDVVGVVVTGLFIAAAVMVPSVAGAVVCGVIAALVATYIGLHVKNSTLPSYKEMEKNKVEHVSSGIQKV